MDIEEKVKESYKTIADRFVRKILKNRTEVDLEIAAYNFEQYLLTVWDIVGRKMNEGRIAFLFI